MDFPRANTIVTLFHIVRIHTYIHIVFFNFYMMEVPVYIFVYAGEYVNGVTDSVCSRMHSIYGRLHFVRGAKQQVFLDSYYVYEKDRVSRQGGVLRLLFSKQGKRRVRIFIHPGCIGTTLSLVDYVWLPQILVLAYECMYLYACI